MLLQLFDLRDSCFEVYSMNVIYGSIPFGLFLSHTKIQCNTRNNSEFDSTNDTDYRLLP